MTKRRYQIQGARWYDARECESIGRILGVERRRIPTEGAYGVRLALRIDPTNELTVLVEDFR